MFVRHVIKKKNYIIILFNNLLIVHIVCTWALHFENVFKVFKPLHNCVSHTTFNPLREALRGTIRAMLSHQGILYCTVIYLIKLTIK